VFKGDGHRAAFFPDSNSIVSVGSGIRFWDVASCKEITKSEDEYYMGEDHTACEAISSDGKYLVALSTGDLE